MVENEKIDERTNRRGPEPRDPEWSALLTTAKANIPDDPARNAEMVDEWRTLDAKWRGCAINTKDFKRADGPVWRASLYLGGEQRVIMRGTLYQCARVYDAALVRFSPYRTSAIDIKAPRNFNFSPEQAREDTGNGDFVALFCGFEDCLRNSGVELLTQEQRDSQRVFHKSEYRRAKLTVGGRLEARLDVQMETMAAMELILRNTNERIASLEGRIAILISELANRRDDKKPMAEWLAQHDKNPFQPLVGIPPDQLQPLQSINEPIPEPILGDFDPSLPSDRSLEQIPVDPFDQ